MIFEAPINRDISGIRVQVDVRVETPGRDDDEDIADPKYQIAGRLVGLLRHQIEAALEMAGMAVEASLEASHRGQRESEPPAR